MQFGGFLATQLTAEEYESHLPSLEVLGHSYHLTPDVAFFLSRPMFVHQIEVNVDQCLWQFECLVLLLNLVC